MKKAQHKAVEHMVIDVIRNSTDTAFARIMRDARRQHLSIEETVRRRLSNLLRTANLRIG